MHLLLLLLPPVLKRRASPSCMCCVMGPGMAVLGLMPPPISAGGGHVGRPGTGLSWHSHCPCSEAQRASDRLIQRPARLGLAAPISLMATPSLPVKCTAVKRCSQRAPPTKRRHDWVKRPAGLVARAGYVAFTAVNECALCHGCGGVLKKKLQAPFA